MHDAERHFFCGADFVRIRCRFKGLSDRRLRLISFLTPSGILGFTSMVEFWQAIKGLSGRRLRLISFLTPSGILGFISVVGFCCFKGAFRSQTSSDAFLTPSGFPWLICNVAKKLHYKSSLEKSIAKGLGGDRKAPRNSCITSLLRKCALRRGSGASAKPPK